MLILELRQVVDILVDGNIQVAGRVVRRNFGSCEGLRHDVLHAQNLIATEKKSYNGQRRMSSKG